MKTKTLKELLDANFKLVATMPIMYAKESDKNVALYRLKVSKVGGDIFERVYHGEKKYIEKELGWEL